MIFDSVSMVKGYTIYWRDYTLVIPLFLLMQISKNLKYKENAK